MSGIDEKVIGILSEIRPEFEFSQQENLFDSGMLDSFDVVMLVTKLDSEFGISIDGTDILPGNFSSVDKIVSLLQKNGVVV